MLSITTILGLSDPVFAVLMSSGHIWWIPSLTTLVVQYNFEHPNLSIDMNQGTDITTDRREP